MKKLILIFIPILLILFSFKFQKNLEISGKYKVIESKPFVNDSILHYPNYIIEINDNKYLKITEDNGRINGNIKIIPLRDYTVLILKDSISDYLFPELDSVARDFYKRRVIELKDSNKDTIKFRTTFSNNLHVTDTEGIFVRIK